MRKNRKRRKRRERAELVAVGCVGVAVPDHLQTSLLASRCPDPPSSLWQWPIWAVLPCLVRLLIGATTVKWANWPGLLAPFSREGHSEVCSEATVRPLRPSCLHVLWPVLSVVSEARQVPPKGSRPTPTHLNHDCGSWRARGWGMGGRQRWRSCVGGKEWELATWSSRYTRVPPQTSGVGIYSLIV